MKKNSKLHFLFANCIYYACEHELPVEIIEMNPIQNVKGEICKIYAISYEIEHTEFHKKLLHTVVFVFFLYIQTLKKERKKKKNYSSHIN